ncbi:DUF945 family protein [Aliiglaciecola sp. 3_MG-2023]|uniref:YdgA family protein n=1 Tax=Aliiglaciecola sp. 3_MG-2023 TaxID=3062644 RepID=UPI0026E12E9E|nr:DUF945 family protein [Aliiglaciecola sp. 3_MG-2023]MDO6691973.1 DUF945 family protein [Aliiglaciecola sp. 3_MG-2023]
MKKRYIVFSLILAAILILPKYFSLQVRGNIEQYIAEINKINGYNVEMVELNDGWFSSNGILKVNISFAQLGANSDLPWAQGNPVFLVDFISHHGPVIFTDGFDIGLFNLELLYKGDELRTKLNWPENSNFYDLTIGQGLLGGFDMEDHIVPFSVVEENHNQNVVFSGYQGEGEQSSGGFSYEGEMGSFLYTSDEGKFEIVDFDIAMESDGEIYAAMSGEIFESTAEVNVNKLNVLTVGESQQSFELDELSFSVSTDINEEEQFMDVAQNLEIESISAMDYDVTDIQLEVETNRLSIPFIKAYQEFAKSLSGMDEIEMRQQSMSFMTDSLLPLLQSAPQVNISKLSANLPEGTISGFSNNQLVGIDALPDATANPKFWIDHTVSETELEMDKDVANVIFTRYVTNQLQLNPQTAEMSQQEIELIAAQQVPNMIEGLKLQGFIVEKDDKLLLHFSLKDGNAVLNDNPIPLPY